MERRNNPLPLIVGHAPEAHCRDFLDGLVITREETFKKQGSPEEVAEPEIQLTPSVEAKTQPEADIK